MSVQLRCLTAFAALAVLAACGGKPADTAKSGAGTADTDAEKIVNVYNWSDYIEPTVIESFEKETGLKVNYEVMDSNALLETKLLAGRTGYDVVVPSASYLARQIKAGSVWINQYNGFDTAMPFGGYKQSGWGRELGAAGLDAYTITKSVNIAL